MKKRWNLFLFRLKLLFFAPDICRIHFEKKVPQEFHDRKGRYQFRKRCATCVIEEKRRAQQRKDSRHWTREEILQQCAQFRKQMGLKAEEPENQLTLAEQVFDAMYDGNAVETPQMAEPVDPGPIPEPLQYNTYLIGADRFNTGMAAVERNEIG